MLNSKPLSGVRHHFNGFGVYHHEESPFQEDIHADGFLKIILPLTPGYVTVTWNHENGNWLEQILQPEQLCIMPPYQSHRLTWHQQAELVLVCIPSSILLQSAQASFPQYTVELRPHVGIIDSLLKQLCLKLSQELHQQNQLKTLYLKHLTTLLTLHLLQNYASLRLNIQNELLPGLVPHKLKQALVYIQTHCCNSNIRITDVAVEIGLSQYHFSRLFKQSMGIPPHKYLNQQRIERAKILLKQREALISDIATQVGFADQSHFTKHFRQLTGSTPQAYRREVRQLLIGNPNPHQR